MFLGASFFPYSFPECGFLVYRVAKYRFPKYRFFLIYNRLATYSPYAKVLMKTSVRNPFKINVMDFFCPLYYSTTNG